MRSLLDPLPRQLSTKALAALVALVVCGTGIAVLRFLETSQSPSHRPVPSVRAAEPAPSTPPPTRTSRPSTWGTAFSGSASSSVLDAAARGLPCAPAREDQPTLARPAVEGT